MNAKNFIENIRLAVTKDQLWEAFVKLSQLLNESPKLKGLLFQQQKYIILQELIEKHPAIGLFLENQITNAIREDILNLLNEIEDLAQGQEVNKEITNYITKYEIHVRNSANTLVNTTIDAKRDVNIINQNILQPTASIPRVLSLSSPFQPEYFIGREEDLKAIRQKLQSPADNALLLVNGLGGMGKTTLASKYYHTYQHEYNHVAWILCEQGIANALLQLAEQLRVKFEDKTPPEVRLNQVLKAMAELPKPCLLVIDNANEIEDLEKNYQKLRQCSNFHLLITTRVQKFHQAKLYPVKGLSKKKALELFQNYYPALKADEEPLFNQIRIAVGGNTLVLELLAKNLDLLNTTKTKYQLKDLLNDLQRKGLLQLSFSEAVNTDYQSQGTMRHETPEAIIGAMYDLTHVSREETKILSVFAVLPAEAIRFETLEIIFQNDSELERKVIQLYKKGWIEFNAEEKSFKCSPVIQDVVKAKNDTLFEDCEGLIDLINNALDTENIHHYESSSFFAHYAASILKNLPAIEDDLGTLCQNLGDFYTMTGDLSLAISAYEKMHTIQNALLLNEPNNENFKNGLAISYSKLGSTHTALGNLQLALTFFEQYNTLEKELYEAYPNNVNFKNNLAISYSKLGDTHTDLGNLQQALTFFEERSRLGKELYEAYPNNVNFKNGLAISYYKLGVFYRDQKKDHPTAKKYFQQCFQIWKELHESFPKYKEFKKNYDWAQNALKNIERKQSNKWWQNLFSKKK